MENQKKTSPKYAPEVRERAVRIEAGRHLGDAIPGARFVALGGNDHWLWAGEQSVALEEIRNFLSQLPVAVRCGPRQ